MRCAYLSPVHVMPYEHTDFMNHVTAGVAFTTRLLGGVAQPPDHVQWKAIGPHQFMADSTDGEFRAYMTHSRIRMPFNRAQDAFVVSYTLAVRNQDLAELVLRVVQNESANDANVAKAALDQLYPTLGNAALPTGDGWTGVPIYDVDGFMSIPCYARLNKSNMRKLSFKTTPFLDLVSSTAQTGYSDAWYSFSEGEAANYLFAFNNEPFPITGDDDDSTTEASKPVDFTLNTANAVYAAGGFLLGKVLS